MKENYNKVFGLTGSIACGKSTVSEIFKKNGIYVIDLDYVARLVVEPGEKGYDEILKNFGSDFINEKGKIDRKKLGNLIFSDLEAKKKLEEILHPLIREKELEIIKKIRKMDNSTPIIVDAALMIETGSYKRYKKIIVVYVPEKLQIERLMKRDNLSFEQALKRVKSQMSIEEKIKYADYIIDNSKSLTDTERQVKKIIEELKSDC